MRAYYEVTTALKNQLESQQINTVTMGAIDLIEAEKQSIFPIAHIIVNNATIAERTISFDISIIYADKVDISVANKKEGTPFYGNDNLIDVMNAMLAEANITTQSLLRGNLFGNHYQVLESGSCEPFTERFTELLSGWMLSFSIQVPNNEVCA
jgi:hypothetical protein